jgi:hypothetical protein
MGKSRLLNPPSTRTASGRQNHFTLTWSKTRTAKRHRGAERFPTELSKEIFGQKGLWFCAGSTCPTKDIKRLWLTMVNFG